MEELKDARDTIIDAARSVFAHYGYKKTTMDEIAQAARKGKSSLYHYFKSKEDVFQAVVDVEFKILEKEINHALRSVEDPREKIKLYIKTRMEALHRLANFYSAFRDEYLEQYTFVKDFRIQIDQFEIEMFKSLLKQGVEQGVFLVPDLDLYSFAIVTAMKGLEYSMAIEKDLNKLRENIDSLTQVLFYGILKR